MMKISKLLANNTSSWKLTTGLGIVLSLYGYAMMPLFPESAHIDVSGYGGPVFAFETANSLSDLIGVFGPLGDPDRPMRISRMNDGNLWDFGFLVVYSLFIATFFCAALRNSRLKNTLRKICGLGIGLGLLSGLMDALENIILLDISSNIEAHANLHLLAYPVWGKFFAIMISTALAGLIIRQDNSYYWRAAGLLTIVSSSTIVIAFIAPASYGWLIRHGVTIGWVIMLAYALKNSLSRTHETST